MKKKILIALLVLMLPAFLIVNLLADESSDNYEEQGKLNSDIMIDSPLFTAKETGEKYVQPESSLIMDDFELVASNNNFELWTNEDNGAIRVKNLNTGYLWASDVLSIDDYSFGKAQARTATAAFELRYAKDNTVKQPVNSSENDFKISVKSNGPVVTYTVKNNDIDIEFKYTLTLTDTGIDLKLPNDSIQEKGDCQLISITFFQYLGSVFGSTVPGYVFVPSGNGGLIRFANNPAINAIYSQSYYGTDANRNKDTEEGVLSLPIYGVTHGVEQNAMLTRIKSGAGLAKFNYAPSSMAQYTNSVSGITQGFHKVYNTFNYREPYNMTIPGASSIYIIPEDYYKDDVEVSYTFLGGEDADYIGMAQAYQQQLVAEGKLSKNVNSGTGNVHIDVLGGETESGILFDKYIKMTTTKQLLTINDELTKKFNNHFVYTLRGFYNNGYSRQSYNNNSFDGSLGRLGDLDSLDYYMYYNPVESYGKTRTSQPSRVLVNIFNEEHYITMEKDARYKYYTEVDSVISGTNSTLKKYNDAVAIDGLGSRLYGDHNSDYTRQDVLNKYSELINVSVPMFKPNEYFLGNTSYYLNMPLYHDRVRFITDSVPFLQIALRGYVDYYSTYLNFSTNQEIDLLKCIEYGSNLAYLISYEESYKLANSLSSHLYATHYGSNKEQMFAQINDASIVLNDVKGKVIIDRNIIESGVVEVVYDGGVTVYVNYTGSDFTYNGVTIASMDYKVVK